MDVSAAIDAITAAAVGVFYVALATLLIIGALHLYRFLRAML
jgi:hypothetical protein